MDFDVNADQRALQDTTRAFCADRYPMTVVRAHGQGFDRARWGELAQLVGHQHGLAKPGQPGHDNP